MKVPGWMRILDLFWGVLLLVALGMCLSGRVPWYKAALPLGPFALHLAFRSRSSRRPLAEAVPPGPSGRRGVPSP